MGRDIDEYRDHLDGIKLSEYLKDENAAAVKDAKKSLDEDIPKIQNAEKALRALTAGKAKHNDKRKYTPEETQRAIRSAKGAIEREAQKLGQGYFDYVKQMSDSHLRSASLNDAIDQYRDDQQRENYMAYLKVRQMEQNPAMRSFLNVVKEQVKEAYYREFPGEQRERQEWRERTRFDSVPQSQKADLEEETAHQTRFNSFMRKREENTLEFAGGISRFANSKKPITVEEDDLTSGLVKGKSPSAYVRSEEFIADDHLKVFQKGYVEGVQQLYDNMPKKTLMDSTEIKKFRQALKEYNEAVQKDVNPDYRNRKLADLKKAAKAYQNDRVKKKGIEGREDRIAFTQTILQLPEFPVNTDSITFNQAVDLAHNMKNKKEIAQNLADKLGISKNKGKER